MLKKILLISGSVIVLLVVVLVIHIAMVMPSYNIPDHHKGLQLSRIDFEQPVDSEQVSKIKHQVRGMKGVENCYFNVPAGNLVYSYYLDKQNSDNVYSQVSENWPHLASKKFVVSKENIAKGCPAMAKGTVQNKLVNTIAGWIN